MILKDPARVQQLISFISGDFSSRTISEAKKSGVDFGITLHLNVDHNCLLWMIFEKGEEKYSITVPMPFMEGGVELIQQNEVLRAVCPFWMEKEQRELDYMAAIFSVILTLPQGIISPDLVKATPYLQRMIYGFRNGNASVIAYRFQQAINEVVNRMPLHETMMNSYAMNNRLMVVDSEFEELASPDQKLQYQTNKARKYYSNGWTAIGLSDGTLADKNYLLKTDLRKLSPFGIRFHNPQRNLYSTLGMKGEEYPNITTQSSKELADKGIARKGYNWFTAFVDIPDIFEDPIMVDRRHCDKGVTYERRFQVFGTVSVKEGESIKQGGVLGVSPDGEPNRFDVICDSAKVIKVAQAYISVGGVATLVHNVIVQYRRNFCDGFKLTNLHGNKGIIRMKDLGYAVDPRTGEKRKIDVIVGGKTIGKRKNYGQVIEALVNNVLEVDTNGNVEPIVIEDDWCQPMDQIEAGLVRRGFRADGTWDCDTYAGKVKAVCGNVFWGVIKTPHDQIWKPGATIRRNGKEVRVAGLKLSHVEFRAIETRFGENSALMDEIMSYMQGSENLHELIKMVRAKVGDTPKDAPLLALSAVKPMDQTTGTIVEKQFIDGTVVDEHFYPDGFRLQLPLPMITLVDEKGDAYEGHPAMFEQMPPEEKAKYPERYLIKELYIPSGVLRKCWRHDTGRLGLSEVGVIVNNVVTMAHRLVAEPENSVHHRMYYLMLSNFFARLARALGGKRGEISTYGMAVRYPFSVKATAALSTTLPKNVVEIHRDMAKTLRVNEGDIVIAERFPCLGFMSVRPQKVHIVDDPMARYIIKASGNSLVSQNLDFDGDVVYLASFHTPAAKAELKREWNNPNQTCYKHIKKLNERKGAPHIKEFTLQDYNIKPFADMTNDEHASIVEKNTGVKAQTGPVIALTYNIMRIVENSDLAKSQKMKVAVEMFLEKAAQSVFEQKHGGKSLYEIVIDGVCTADVEMLVEVGFKRGTTEKLCDLIRTRANAMGIFDLKKLHQKCKEAGGSNLISRIVRKHNRIYFASRSTLEGTKLLKAMDAPAVDIPSKMFKWIMTGKIKTIKTILDKVLEEEALDKIQSSAYRDVAKELCSSIDSMINYDRTDYIREIGKQMREALKGGLKACQCGK